MVVIPSPPKENQFQLTILWNCGSPVYPDGTLCISILHEPGADQWGYEDAGERWLPVHTLESIVRYPRFNKLSRELRLRGNPSPLCPGSLVYYLLSCHCKYGAEPSYLHWRLFGDIRLPFTKILSVISMLSADMPDTNSPANVDAAKQVREDFPAFKKKVRRLVRQSAEEAF